MRLAPPAGGSARLVSALLLAFALHAAFGGHLIIGLARPNISLTALLTACLFVNTETGTLLGFMIGLLEASFAARTIGSYIVSRTLAGFLVGLLEERVFRDTVFVATATAFVGTLVVDTIFFAFAPQPNALRLFTGTLLQAVCNAILAIPMYLFFKKILPRAAH
jgi:rod shape-determining protein MreD